MLNCGKMIVMSYQYNDMVYDAMWFFTKCQQTLVSDVIEHGQWGFEN